MRLAAFLDSRPGLVLRYGVSLAAVVWIFFHLDVSSFRHLASANGWLAALALAFAGFAFPLQAWRWHVLLVGQGIRVPFRWTHQIVWIGQFYNAFLPGGIAGDAVRLGYLWQRTDSNRAKGATTLVADRLLGVVGLFVILAAASSLKATEASSSSDVRSLAWGSWIALACVALGGVAGWLALRRGSPARRAIPARFAGVLEACDELNRDPLHLVQAIGLSILVWAADIAALWTFGKALGLEMGAIEIAVAGSAGYLAAVLPISVGGHGVREGAFVAVLALMTHGATPKSALSDLAAAFLAVTLFWSLFGGLFVAGRLLSRRRA